MNNYLFDLFVPASQELSDMALAFMRIGIGVLTIGHGLPKIMGGTAVWRSLGGVMGVLGIHFLPTLWGFLAACAEFFGGIALTLGLGTRIAAFFLSCMMIVAFMMHKNNKDDFTVYSFALSMLVIFLSFMVMGGGVWSVDMYLTR